jgi:NCAIR mutase (PurE)-related protein
MNEQELAQLMKAVRSGKISSEDAVERLKNLPFEDLGFAKIDHHRALRQGFAEVIFGKGKTPKQVAEITKAMLRRGPQQNILITRADEKIFAGTICVVSAGTSDIPVAEEAVLTAQLMGNQVERLYDVGVAGIHRLLQHRAELTKARVIICVAGMEGALPSVVGGLVAVPVIAVPTSVGYGASFSGVAALLGMLNSCASNVTVVNIDNGFGAARVATCINRL